MAQEEEVNVIIAGDLKGTIVNASVNYESFTLLPSGREELSHYLEQQMLKKEAIEDIISTLNSGVSANPGCVSNYEECVVSPGINGVSYLFDLDNNLLKMFVSPELISNSSSATEYYSPVKSDIALINKSNLYIDSDLESEPTMTFSNETLLGLPVGYVFADTQYSDKNKTFDVYSAYYDTEYGPNKIRLGKVDTSSLSFNTTDFLANDANYDSVGLFWGSSYNLAKTQGGNVQKIFYFAPQNGLLEVYKGDRLLFTKNVAQGRQSILYSDLPSGAYNITIKLKVGSQLAFEENRQVINNQKYSLPKGNFDFFASIAQFDASRYGSYSADSHNIYAKGGISYRPFDAFLIAGGLTSNGSELYSQLGGQYYYSDVLSLVGHGGYFTSGSRYYSSELLISPFSLSWSQYHVGDVLKPGLSAQLYGDDGYNKYSIGISGTLANGFTYVSFNQYSYKDYTIDTLSGSWSHTLLGGTFSVNANYNKHDSNKDPDQYSIGLSWSRALGDSLNTTISAYSDQAGFNRVSSNVGVSTKYHDWFLSSNVSSALISGNDALFDASFAASGHNNYAKGQFYGFVNNSGGRALSATLSNTQVYSRDGVFLTDKNAHTYINIETQGTYSDDARVFYNISKNGRSASREQMKGMEVYVPTEEYQYTQIILDAETSDLELANDRTQFFTQPGAIYRLNTDVYPLESKIYLLSDIDQKPIQSLSCKGQGCVSVEPLSNDGVFRVNYRVGQKFELFSAKNLCVSPWGENRNSFTSGFCLPGISNDESLVAYQREIDNADKVRKVLFYLGRFDDQDAASRILDKLKQANIEVKAITVEPDLYVYAKDPGVLTVAQQDLLQSLNAYVLDDLQDAELASSRGIDYDF
ncbi:TcfC E-set like domain-containing protein [Photobacterium damselae]|uniref:TcfC E-set like domain-containing protein n=1 Tax=Photobacterium damselae TaxID=38293 RepID=UPI001F20F403|nr:TcfC E-set like domain-containing protein [Photobacterium damselae]UKA03999.1 TcfC E-set like domain-containing protein [Photobacterium damselae subsp. damselae]